MLVVGGPVVNSLSLVFPEICPKGNWLQSWLHPKKEKDQTGPDFQTLFGESILRKLQSLPPIFRPAYASSIVILSAFDFLDGWLLYTYRYIAFDDFDTPFVDHLTTHTEDLLCNKPDLFHFTLSPRL